MVLVTALEMSARKRIFPAAMSNLAAAHALTQQFLAWVEEAPRNYADAEAWRRSCPHLSIWEDAISDGLVRFQNGSSMQASRLVLTPRGKAALRQR
jgi:hypothetical protein